MEKLPNNDTYFFLQNTDKLRDVQFSLVSYEMCILHFNL